MQPYRIVIDTNVVVAALRSRRGTSHTLLMQLGNEKFSIHLSVPLILEYEDVLKRMIDDLQLTEQDVDDVLDYICAVAGRHPLYYLWRPCLNDPKDDMALELAVTASCDFIVTFNQRDFAGAEQFGIAVTTPREFLERIGELE